MIASRRAPAPSPSVLDLLAVAADAVHNAQAVSPDRSIRLDVGETDPPPIITGDEPRLPQIVGNLMATPSSTHRTGTSVAVRVAVDAGHNRPPVVVVIVADDGPA